MSVVTLFFNLSFLIHNIYHTSIASSKRKGGSSWHEKGKMYKWWGFWSELWWSEKIKRQNVQGLMMVILTRIAVVWKDFIWMVWNDSEDQDIGTHIMEMLLLLCLRRAYFKFLKFRKFTNLKNLKFEILLSSKSFPKIRKLPKI